MLKELFLHIKKQLALGKPCYFIALLESEGSTPRSSDAYMLVGEDGLLCGTIGGGSMEYAAQQLAQQLLLDGKTENFAKTYDLSPAVGLACGGCCQVQFCYLAAADDNLSLAEQALRLLEENNPWWLLLPLGIGRLQIRQTLPAAGRRGRLELDGCQYYAEQYGYDGLVYVFGAGHVARELVPLLSHVGFRCVVLDDRQAFADAAVFPDAIKVSQVDFHKLDNFCSLGSDDYAVVMTRGHLYDACCQRYLLTTKACYIGIMGSKNKARLAREALLAEGYTPQQLSRVITPIGLDIGSETPAEIAVSIAAQLIKVRAAKG